MKLTINTTSQMLVFDWGEGKPEYQEKTSRCRVENQQTQPTYDAESRNWTWATLVGGEWSHHCVIPAPQENKSRVRGFRCCVVVLILQQICGRIGSDVSNRLMMFEASRAKPVISQRRRCWVLDHVCSFYLLSNCGLPRRCVSKWRANPITSESVL